MNPRTPSHEDEHTVEMMRYIEWFISVHRRSPSVRELQKGLKIASVSHVYWRLKKLERDGYIKIVPNIYNGIRLTNKRMFI